LCGRIAVAATLACALVGGALPAAATAAEPTQCQGEKLLYELYAYAVGMRMIPESGAEVGQRSSVALSSESETQLRLNVASSEAGLARPDIDSGAGTAGPGTDTTRWTFNSTKATARPGTVYWDASFTRPLPSCGGGIETFRTGARALQVISAAEMPPPIPSPETNTTYSAPTATGLKVGITAARVVRGHASVAYLVDCTAQCSGRTYVHAWVLRGHKRALRARQFDFGPRNVSISAPSGGNQRFTVRFRGSTLKQLKSMLHGGGELKLAVTAAVKDTAGHGAQAARTILMHR
jgi:hypothetical protein